jgi:hypothetical protein
MILKETGWYGTFDTTQFPQNPFDADEGKTIDVLTSRLLLNAEEINIDEIGRQFSTDELTPETIYKILGYKEKDRYF